MSCFCPKTDSNSCSHQQTTSPVDDYGRLPSSAVCHAKYRSLEQDPARCNGGTRLNTSQVRSGHFSKCSHATHAGEDRRSQFQSFNPGHNMSMMPPAIQDTKPRTLIQCYMGQDNDESYRKWAGDKLLEQLSRHDYQTSLGAVPDDIRDLPGHCAPTRTETTNQTYGNYLDLLPRFPAEYPLPTVQKAQPMKLLVRFKKSNMSDRLPIPNHQFALDPESQVNRDGYYTISSQCGGVHFPEVAGVRGRKPYTFQRNPPILGETHGERRCGFTFPLHSKTGLEINRPV